MFIFKSQMPKDVRRLGYTDMLLVNFPRGHTLIIEDLGTDIAVILVNEQGEREALYSAVKDDPPTKKFPGAVAYPIEPPNIQDTTITRDIG